MRLAEAFRVALDALRANRLRSALTMLGVVIGVAAVVVLVAIGTGAKQEVEQQVEGLGSNIIIVVPGRFEFGSAPTVEPAAARRRRPARPGRRRPRRVAVSVASGEDVRCRDRREPFVTVDGDNENVPNVFDRPLARGEYITAADVDTRRRVAVLGATSPTGCSATSTRSAGRCPSPACGSGSIGVFDGGRLDVRRRPRRRRCTSR